MKSILVFSLSMMISSFSFADDYACTIKVQNDSAVEYEDSLAPRSAYVSLFGYQCVGRLVEGGNSVKLLGASLDTDGVLAEIFSEGPAAATVSLEEAGVSCTCDLR